MSVSKHELGKTNSLTDAAVEQSVTALQRPTDSSHGSHPKTSLGTVFFWSVVVVASIAGWIYREPLGKLITTVTGTSSGSAAKTQPPRIIPVVTAVVQQKNMDVYINGLGTVTAFKTVTVRSRVEGELINVAFTEGQVVREGDLLAEIDRRPYEVQLQQADGQLTRDEATLKSAELTLKRYQELIATKAITGQQMDEQRALVQQMNGAIKSDEGAIANAKLQLTYCRITSPISGRLGLRLVDQGNIVRANDPMGLVVITQLQPIALVFTIPQDDIVRVQKPLVAGQELKVEAWDRAFSTKLATGKLAAIDNQVDSLTGTVRLKAVFENTDGMLFPNQFVNVRLLVDTRTDAVVVPSAAVQRGPNGVFVYAVQADDKVELKNVTVGLVEGAETLIQSGLNPGEIVVTDGIDKLQPGTQITTREKEKAKEAEKGDDKASKGDSKATPTKERGEYAKPKTETAKEAGKKGSQ